MAAYNPEPHRASEARGFVGQNPAQQPQGQNNNLQAGNAGQYAQKGQVGPRVSPGLNAATAQAMNSNMEETRAKAEKMVNAEREARGRLPVYEGLPSHFKLEVKMGE